MNSKATFAAATAGAVLTLFAGAPAPQVSDVRMSQNAQGVAKIRYTLSAAAVVIRERHHDKAAVVRLRLRLFGHQGPDIAIIQMNMQRRNRPVIELLRGKGQRHPRCAEGEIRMLKRFAADHPVKLLLMDLPAGERILQLLPRRLLHDQPCSALRSADCLAPVPESCSLILLHS